VLDLQGLDPTREIKAAIEEGASDAEKEMATARTAIDGATADALPAPAVSAAELTADNSAPPATSDAQIPPLEPELAAVPPSNEAPAAEHAEADTPASTEPVVPAPANEPAQETPQKVAVG
jgi:hypothetical protein